MNNLRGNTKVFRTEASKLQYLAALISLVCCLQAELIQPVVSSTQNSDQPPVPLQLHCTLNLCLSDGKLFPGRI